MFTPLTPAFSRTLANWVRRQQRHFSGSRCPPPRRIASADQTMDSTCIILGRAAPPSLPIIQSNHSRSWFASPLRHTNIDVPSKRYRGTKRSVNCTRRQHAIRMLPHQPNPGLGSWLEGEAIGKIEIRIEDHHFLGIAAEQQRIGHLAPTRMTAPKGPQIWQTGPLFICANFGVGVIDDLPAMRGRIGQ